jgi:hypothetical protein
MGDESETPKAGVASAFVFMSSHGTGFEAIYVLVKEAQCATKLLHTHTPAAELSVLASVGVYMPEIADFARSRCWLNPRQ